jgi:MFS transporter, AAHS family, 3-hydroxyphenylpropionic acid transporter
VDYRAGTPRVNRAPASGHAPAVRATIIFCLLAALCEGIDLQAAGVAAAGIASQFKPLPDQLGNFFSASTFGLFFGALIGGRLADNIGRKTVLVSSIALFGLFSLLTSAAWDMSSLAWARLLTGLGLGGALPNLIALVTENSREHRHSANVALVYSATPFGGAIASLLSMLLAASHWRWIFIVGGVVPLLLAPVMAYWLPESGEFRRLQLASSRTSTAASAALLPSMPKRGSFAAIFADGRALPTIWLWLTFFLELLMLYLLLNWLPTLLVGDGLTRTQAAGAQIGFNVGGALAALGIGYLLEGKLRNRSIILTFIALPILLVVLAKSPPQVAVLTLVVFVLGCAVLAAQAFLYAMAPAPYPTAIRGVGVGTAVAVGRIGAIVGPKLGGLLKAAGHGYSRLLMDLLPIVILGSVCALLLAWYSPRRTHGTIAPPT